MRILNTLPERGLIYPRLILFTILWICKSPFRELSAPSSINPQLRYACSGLRIEVSFQDTPWMNDYHSKYLMNLIYLRFQRQVSNLEIRLLIVQPYDY